MEQRRYRNTEEEVSLLGFGCMRLPRLSAGRQEIDAALAQKMVDYAFSHGVNYFDTAYPYHEGKSELFIGEALKKYPRGSFFLADKMPGWLLRRQEDGPKYFEEQLRKCQADYFDFYLCHSIHSSGEFIRQYGDTGVLGYLERQKEAGRIRHLGFSFHGSAEELEKMLERGGWDFVQIQLNYLDWEIQSAKEKYRMLEERGVPCIVMEPIRGGNLCTLCEESVDLLKSVRPEKSIASWAIRFAASLPGVLTVLSGMTAMSHVEDNVATMTDFEPLSEKERRALEQAGEAFLRTGTIPCTGCRYCMDCPMGVDIPGVFSVYNECAASMHLPVTFGGQHTFDRNAPIFLKAYEGIPEEHRADHCIACEKCMQHCPQGIKIPERMKEISVLAANLRG